MSKARVLINAHLYPVLATFAVVYGAIQIAPIAQQARDINACVESVYSDRAPRESFQTPKERDKVAANTLRRRRQVRAYAVAACNCGN